MHDRQTFYQGAIFPARQNHIPLSLTVTSGLGYSMTRYQKAWILGMWPSDKAPALNAQGPGSTPRRNGEAHLVSVPRRRQGTQPNTSFLVEFSLLLGHSGHGITDPRPP